MQILSKRVKHNGRFNSICILIDWLVSHGLKQNEIFLCERLQYRHEQFDGQLVSGVPGWAPQRNSGQLYMFDQFWPEQLVLHFDDVAVGLNVATVKTKMKLQPVTSCGLARLIRKASKEMESSGARLFCVNMSLIPQNIYCWDSAPMRSLGFWVLSTAT